MKFAVATILTILAAYPGTTAVASELTYRVTIHNTSSSEIVNVPVTFGHPFLRGDVPSGYSLQGIVSNPNTPVTIQVDKKASHQDGSLRHAVISTVLPTLAANASITLELRPTQANSAGAPVSRQSLIDAGQTVDVDLHMEGGTYRAQLAAAIQNPILQWLEGPLASEWVTDLPFRRISDQQPHSDLRARFYARKYHGTNNVRVDVVVENLTTFVGTRSRFDYNAEVRINGKTVLAKNTIPHFANTRWKYTFWTLGEPPVHVAFDPATLMATGAIPSYDTRLIGNTHGQPSYSEYRTGEYVEHDGGYIIDRYGPMGRGGPTSGNMSTAGQRKEIGPLPEWTVNWLLTQSPHAKYATLRNSDLASSWGIHYRDEATGFPVTIDERYNGYPGWGVSAGSPSPHPVSEAPDSSTYLRADTAHQPQFSFVPYLISGDFYHFEELDFWAAYNLARENPGTVSEPNTRSGDGYRNQHKGYITNRGQYRAIAWNLRTLAMIAAFTPDNYYTKPYWSEILENNIERFSAVWASRNNYGAMVGTCSDSKPWMDDYVTWATGYTLGLGYETIRPAAEWKARYPIARMGKGQLSSNWCWQAAADYSFGGTQGDSCWASINDWWAEWQPNAVGKVCNTQAMADAIGVSGPGDMLGRPGSSSSYVAQLAMGLAVAVDMDMEGARDAWNIYIGVTGERNRFPDFRGEPRFALFPRTYNPVGGTLPRPPGGVKVE
jgi:hypothetical protein